MSKKPKVYNGRYEKLGKLGEGTYGKVRLVLDLKARLNQQKGAISEENKGPNPVENGRFPGVFAVKKSKTEKHQSLQKFQGVDFSFLREIKIMREIHHENIIELKDVFFEEDHVFLVMDYMCYNLKSLIENHFQSLTLEDIKSLMAQILRGVNVLHKSWIVHRDITPANMLLNAKGTLKISDLGLSKYFGSPDRKMTKDLVTIAYRAPEILFGSDVYGHKVDIWAVGCIMAELFFGGPIFPGTTQIDQLIKIFQVLGTPDESNWANCDKLPNFVQFRKSPGISWREIIYDIPEEAADLLSKLLVLNPLKRIEAEEALQHPFFKDAAQKFKPTYMELYKSTAEKALFEHLKPKSQI